MSVQRTVVAPRAGVVAEFNPAVHAGRAIARSEFIALIKGGDTLVARGYVAERDLGRLAPGASGRFIADLPARAVMRVQLQDIAQSGAQSIDLPELTSNHGGPIAVRPLQSESRQRRFVPVESHYLATLLSTTRGTSK